MSVYENKPDRFLHNLHQTSFEDLPSQLLCAGFELGVWRCKGFAFHLAEWLPDYALPEEELRMNHATSLAKINQAAVRVYTSSKYQKRGEAGEIALHAICRDFFGTIPISPRVFYKSSSNDVVKAFDMVHARFLSNAQFEIWLGESKLYEDGKSAVADAIASIRAHMEAGFLSNEKLLLGPQIPKTTPHYDAVLDLFKGKTSIDELLKRAVFPVGIFCDSAAAKSAKEHDAKYLAQSREELADLATRMNASGLPNTLKVLFIYIPLATKATLVKAFDERLKGLQ